MIYCTNSTDALVTLESMESWKKMLNAVCIRNYQRHLEPSQEDHGSKVPFRQLHRTCRSVFTMKRDLEKLQKSQKQVCVI